MILQKIYRKLRHRKGDGIHSPFVYDLITHVFEEQLPFYAFEEIENKQASRITCTKNYGRLLFRLVNYLRCKSVIELGTNKNIYIEKALPQKGASYSISEKLPDGLSPVDMIVISQYQDELNIEKLFMLIDTNSVIIIDNIAQKGHNKELWESLRTCKQVSVSIDLYSVGLLFFNKKITNKHYKLYYNYGKK
ncbi:hypothetical protein LJB98_00455 [Bacteroidales bacterium OttesenSCG-928-M11]|nr:hypothetical protein [Bacteroidales bacterium OttesenSCG-928-M11]